jgi:TPP-dependent indolepyruvate ferredoxin oxidoreductase alpha subunit
MAPVDPQALIAKAEAVAQQFEFGPEDVRKGVKEFIREMGTQKVQSAPPQSGVLIVTRPGPARGWPAYDDDPHICHQCPQWHGKGSTRLFVIVVRVLT